MTGRATAPRIPTAGVYPRRRSDHPPGRGVPGGRPDLTRTTLIQGHAPTLLPVGEHDEHVLDLDQRAADAITGVRQVQLIKPARHLLKDAGTMHEVVRQAAAWFDRYLAGDRS